MSRAIGAVNAIIVEVSGAGVTVSPPTREYILSRVGEVRALAKLLERAADEVTRMRGERAELGDASAAADLKPCQALPDPAPEAPQGARGPSGPPFIRLETGGASLPPGEHQARFVSYDPETNTAVYDLITEPELIK